MLLHSRSGVWLWWITKGRPSLKHAQPIKCNRAHWAFASVRRHKLAPRWLLARVTQHCSGQLRFCARPKKSKAVASYRMLQREYLIWWYQSFVADITAMPQVQSRGWLWHGHCHPFKKCVCKKHNVCGLSSLLPTAIFIMTRMAANQCSRCKVDLYVWFSRGTWRTSASDMQFNIFGSIVFECSIHRSNCGLSFPSCTLAGAAMTDKTNAVIEIGFTSFT